MADIKFEIQQTVGVLSESTKGWKKELNLISWNDKDAKYDIREWAPLVVHINRYSRNTLLQ